MKLFQLFNRAVPQDVVAAAARAFGLRSLSDTSAFTVSDMQREGTVAALAAMKPVLESYYMPCKAKVYLADLDETRCVTVLRHLLRCADRCVVAFEKSCGAGKLTYYSIRKQVDPSLRFKITPGRVRVDFGSGVITQVGGSASPLTPLAAEVGGVTLGVGGVALGGASEQAVACP